MLIKSVTIENLFKIKKKKVKDACQRENGRKYIKIGIFGGLKP